MKNYCGKSECFGQGHYEHCGKTGIGEAMKKGSGPHQCGDCRAKDMVFKLKEQGEEIALAKRILEMNHLDYMEDEAKMLLKKWDGV
tara:strand:- start:6140 stop:6397 length:258 start_codon:yes stop_codon:yes gene_type:complete